MATIGNSYYTKQNFLKDETYNEPFVQLQNHAILTSQILMTLKYSFYFNLLP